MSLFKRRILALFFVILFFTILPLLIMITSGQLYNVKKRKFEKTGLLVVSTDPPGANILLDGEIPYTWFARFFKNVTPKNYYTPKRLNYLLPSTYELTLTKDGFYPWRATINIKSGETTFAEGIRLWTQKEFEPITSTSSQVLSINPTGTLTALWNEKTGLSVIDTAGNSLWNSKETQKSALYWHDNSNAFLAVQNSGIKVIHPFTNTEENVFIPINASIIWDPQNEEKIFWKSGNTIFETDITNKNVQTIFKSGGEGINLKDWRPYNGTMFIITPSTIETIRENERESFEAPRGTVLKRILEAAEESLIIATENDGLFIFKSKNGKWEILTNEKIDAYHIILDETHNIYWWWNDFEIGTISREDGKANVITRVSSKINDVELVISEIARAVIVASESSLFAIDARNQEKTTITTIREGQNFEDIIFDENGEILYAAENTPDGLMLLEYNSKNP